MADENTQTALGAAAYLELFGDKAEKALEIAHDVRQFEIDLYWKRAAYFWTIIAVAFAGFFTCQNAGNLFGSAIVSYLGFIISLSWYLVNRGGAAWQHNWELHVDLLEDQVTGPIYKTLINRKKYHFWELTGPYPFSPSRVNALISIFVCVSWICLIGRAGYVLFINASTTQFDAIIVATLFFVTIIVAGLLFASTGKRARGQDEIEARTRGYKPE